MKYKIEKVENRESENGEKTTMKKRILKAIFVAISIAFGITLVTFLYGEEFSLVKPGLYAIIAFIIDFIFSFLFDKKIDK